MSEKDIKKNEVPQNRDKEFLADPWARTRTRNGLAADEVISALQKSIRKGKERAACEFAYEMYISSPQMEEKLWRRLQAISVEDRLIFQPAEENFQGAYQVIEAGGLDGVSAIIGYHNNPHLKPGHIGLRSGAIMAGVEQFRVDVKGVSSHAARPDLGVDTVLVTTTIINNLQQIVARTVSPFESAVLSVTHIEVGNTWNVLPAAGFFEGTIRTFEPKVREDVIARFEKVGQATADQFGAQVDITWGNSPYVTYNDQTLTPLIFENSKAFAEVIETLPSTGGEDFAAYQKEIPGVFAFIGSNGEDNAPDWHHDDFLVKDEALPVAVNYYVENALFLLDYFKEQ